MSKIRIQVVSTYPDKSAFISVPSDASLGDLKAEAAKELKLDLKEYSFSSIAFGEDVTPLSGDTKPEIKDNWTLIAAAPSHLLPPRKKKDEKKDDGDDKFKDFTPENVFKKLATTKGKEKKLALEYLDTYAQDIVKTPIFSKLPASSVAAIVKRDGLSISEIELFEAILKWADGELKNLGKIPSDVTRGEILKEILPHIRFPVMSTEEVAAKVTPTGLLTSAQSLDLYTYLAQPSGTPGSSLSQFKFKARAGSGGAKLAPPSDEYGDGGIFWWIGSQAGKKTWTNPHSSGLVRMFTSDTPGWTTGWSEVNLVDLLSTSRSISTDYSMNTGTWFAVDLKDFRVCPTHYTLKNGGGRGLVLREWAFEGKVKETDSWTQIRRHADDSTFSADGKNGYGIHRFEISPTPKEFYRFFRILRTDTNKAIYVHRWEIYGTIKKGK